MPGRGFGFVEPGNINLNNRPRVQNADGSISTVRSMSRNIDGMEVLFPTVSEDGRIMSNEEATQQYLRTGRHLGKFRTPGEATTYAHSLHDDQDRIYNSMPGRLSQLEDALRNADAAGDVEAAKKLADEIVRVRSTNPSTEAEEPQKSTIGRKGDKKPGDRIEADLPYMFMHGGSFGAADEILAGLMTPFHMSEGLPMKEAFQQGKAREDAVIEATREQYPTMSTVAEIAGGIGGLKGRPVPATRPEPLIGRIGRGARAGSIGGGTYGFMTGDDLQSRVRGAGQGAATGAVIGSALPPAIAAVRGVTKTVTAPFRSYGNPGKYASEKVSQAFARDKKSPARVLQELDDLRQVSPQAMVADVGGDNVRGLMRSSLNMPNSERDAFGKHLDVRQAGQFRRVKDAFGKALGSSDDFYATTAGLVKHRKDKADLLFDAARRTPTPYDKPLEGVLNRPLMKNLVAQAQDAARNRGENFKPILKQHPAGAVVKGKNVGGQFYYDRIPRTEDLHRIKLHIDEVIRSLKSGQDSGLKNAQLRDLTILKKDLLKSINNPAYKRALDEFAGDSAMMNALDEGFEKALAMAPEEISATMQGMTLGEQALFRLGLSRAVVDRLGRGHVNHDRVRMLNSPEFMSRLKAAFPDMRKGSHHMVRDIQRMMAQENKFTRTRQAAQGNSTTARQIMEGQDAGIAAEGGEVALQAIRGDWLGVLQRVGKRFTGMNPRAAAETLKILREGDYASKVSAADLRRMLGDQKADRLISVLTRVASQRGSDPSNRLLFDEYQAPRSKQTERLPAL